MIPYGKWRPVAVRWEPINSYTLFYPFYPFYTSATVGLGIWRNSMSFFRGGGGVSGPGMGVRVAAADFHVFSNCLSARTDKPNTIQLEYDAAGLII